VASPDSLLPDQVPQRYPRLSRRFPMSSSWTYSSGLSMISTGPGAPHFSTLPNASPKASWWAPLGTRRVALWRSSSSRVWSPSATTENGSPYQHSSHTWKAGLRGYARTATLLTWCSRKHERLSPGSKHIGSVQPHAWFLNP
jgi:hypothetical protein